MARQTACTSCGEVIDNINETTVLFTCNHIQHEQCYFLHHANNLVCPLCGITSDQLLFY